MRKLIISFAILSTALMANAQITILVPNGDFSTGDNTSWQEVSGGGTGATYSYPTTGGNPGGYGQIDSTAGSWAIWVANSGPEVIDLSYFGVSAGDTITVTLDLIEFSNNIPGTEPPALQGAGIKMESWGPSGFISSSGDIKFAPTGSWATYTYDYTIDPSAIGIKFVPVQHNEISVGYDNIGVVVPEPTTYALMFGFVTLGFVLYRRRKAAQA